MKIARLIITKDCNRSCSYCCNKYDSLMSQATEITDLNALTTFDQICITGGEPMLRHRWLYETIIELRQQSLAFRPIYVYTALYTPKIREIVDIVNGVHFTLHEKATKKDVEKFQLFQDIISTYQNKSFRLYVHPKMRHDITISPTAWSRIELKQWLPEASCPLPPNETLFILKDYYV